MNLLFCCLMASKLRKVHRIERPTSHPSGPDAHGCKWPHEKWMILHCTPQLNTDKPSWHPHIKMKGCHVSRDGNLQGLRDGQGGASCACAPPQP